MPACADGVTGGSSTTDRYGGAGETKDYSTTCYANLYEGELIINGAAGKRIFHQSLSQ